MLPTAGRFGKSHFAVAEMLDRALRNTRRFPQYAYLGPTYGAAKRIIWQIFKEYVKNIPNVEINEAELRIDLHRPAQKDFIRFMLLGAENPGNLRGIYLDGVTMDEYAEMHPDVWIQVIRPALSDRLGWAIFIGTPKARNHFYDVYEYAGSDPENWFRAIFKASETGVVNEAELAAARREMSEEMYLQEFECSFTAALTGAYFGKEMVLAEQEGRIRTVPHEKSLPVFTAWDLGIGDQTAIWFIQEVGKEYHAIDYFEVSGMGLPEIIAGINKRPYNYGDHYFPHDIAVRELGNNGQSREKTLRDLGVRNIRVGKKHTGSMFMDSIHLVRMMIAKTWFDRTKCEKGIKALQNYSRKWDDKLKVYQERPTHDWASHGADAFREFADQHRGGSFKVDTRNLPRQAQSTYNIFG